MMKKYFNEEEGYRREGVHTNEIGIFENFIIRFKRQIIIFFTVVVVFIFIVIRVSSGILESVSGAMGLWYPQQSFYHRYLRTNRESYDVAFISDDDKKSRRIPDKLAFTSTLLRAKLNPVKDKKSNKVKKYQLVLREDIAQEITTTYNENGRGMELSDLCNFNDKLLAFDDRTGIIFWYNKAINKMIPYIVLIEGNAIDGDKGQKTEWAFVAPGYYRGGRRKERDVLYVGSIGKEWNDPKTGKIVNLNNQWVKIIDIIPPDGKEYGSDFFAKAQKVISKGVNDYTESFQIEHVNVRNNLYEVMRKKTGALNPGYIVHEAACYNTKYHNWWFLPRRHSREPYNEQADEHAGTNLVFVVNTTDPFHATAAENEAKMEVRHLGVFNNTRGWSSLNFYLIKKIIY